MARSLGQETVVQPRPRALFEPDKSGDPETDREQKVELVAEPLAAQRPAQPIPQAVATPPSPEPILPRSQATPTTRPAPAPSALTEPSEREHETLAAEVGRDTRLRAHSHTDATPTDGRPAELVPATVAPAADRRRRPRPHATRIRLASPITDRFTETAELGEPIVRVTIGRVDVRAVLAPPEPPRQAPSKPTRMTLDEYLARSEKP